MRSQSFFFLFTVIIIIGGGILSCQSLQPQRIAYISPEKSLQINNWEKLFQKASSIDSFKVLNTGSVKVPLNGMLNIKKLPKNHGLTDYLWVEVFVFLFHHQEHGWFMIDTGLDHSFQKEGNIKGIFASNYIKAARQLPMQNIGAQLHQENKEINGVFFTHLHGDHTAGLPEIPDNIPKYVGKNEPYHSIPFFYQPNHLSKRDTLIELDWEQGTAIAPFKSVLDIFGDGSFLGIHTPGHSMGHLSYLLITATGSILLTGDASHTKYGFQNGIEPGWVANEKLAAKSLTNLIQFTQMYPEIQVIYGHER